MALTNKLGRHEEWTRTHWRREDSVTSTIATAGEKLLVFPPQLEVEMPAVADEWSDKWPRYYTWDDSLHGRKRVSRGLDVLPRWKSSDNSWDTWETRKIETFSHGDWMRIKELVTLRLRRFLALPSNDIVGADRFLRKWSCDRLGTQREFSLSNRFDWSRFALDIFRDEVTKIRRKLLDFKVI